MRCGVVGRMMRPLMGCKAERRQVRSGLAAETDMLQTANSPGMRDVCGLIGKGPYE
jgi:hypothetical protein